jgi:hypothetical protein
VVVFHRREIRLSHPEGEREEIKKNAEIAQAQKEIRIRFPSFMRGSKMCDPEIGDVNLSAELS